MTGKRQYEQKGDKSVVETHAEQRAPDHEIPIQGRIVRLKQNAWPCNKCLEKFPTRSDLKGKTVIINVVDDHGLYGRNNMLPDLTIGQLIIDDRVIRYANLAKWQ